MHSEQRQSKYVPRIKKVFLEYSIMSISTEITSCEGASHSLDRMLAKNETNKENLVPEANTFPYLYLSA